MLSTEYHHRQANLLMRLFLAARDADTSAAFLWLATKHRARADRNGALAEIVARKVLELAQPGRCPRQGTDDWRVGRAMPAFQG
jgi:hypothetical protein